MRSTRSEAERRRSRWRISFARLGLQAGIVPVPLFVQNLATAFIDAQAKRHDADYDLNKPLSEVDARLLRTRVERVIATWRAATSKSDRDFKHALCVLIVLKGKVRLEQG